MLKISLAQIPVTPSNLRKNFETMCRFIQSARSHGSQLIIFPEMCLSGYFLGDTWEQQSFLKECEDFHAKILSLSSGIDIIFGSVGIDWNKRNEDGRIRKYNAVYHAKNTQFMRNKKTSYSFWPKTLMPNYREFDDSRHFYDLKKLSFELSCKPEDLYEATSIEWAGKSYRIGLTICEDGWSQDYAYSPFERFSEHDTHDFFVNLSCSPYTKGKSKSRIRNFLQHAMNIKKPILYVNCVGTQNVAKTIYGFDGSSALFTADGKVEFLGDFFKESLVQCEFDGQNICSLSKLQFIDKLLDPHELSIAIETTIKACCEAWGIKKVLIGVSGGIDSALSAVIFVRVLGSENVFLVNMPSKFNASETQNAARQLAKNLACAYTSISIEESVQWTHSQLLQTSFENAPVSLKITPLVKENIQARDRGSRIISALAASLNAVFPCNANKCELTVGYCTLYGDQIGFLCPLADLWKQDVYALAHFYNEGIFENEIIPKFTLNVVPSAELSVDQNVLEGKGDPLIYPYHDCLFRSWVEHWDRKTPEDCLQAYLNDCLDELIDCELGLTKKYFPTVKNFIPDLERWWKNYRGMGAFKRVQAPPVLAFTRRAFGFDHREHIGETVFSERYLSLKHKALLNFKLDK